MFDPITALRLSNDSQLELMQTSLHSKRIQIASEWINKSNAVVGYVFLLFVGVVFALRIGSEQAGTYFLVYVSTQIRLLLDLFPFVIMSYSFYAVLKRQSSWKRQRFLLVFAPLLLLIMYAGISQFLWHLFLADPNALWRGAITGVIYGSAWAMGSWRAHRIGVLLYLKSA